MPYPVNYVLQPQPSGHNRITTLFRLILAIPQLMIVGVLAQVAQIMAVIAWVIIIVTGGMPRGLWDFIAGYMRWKTRMNAYTALHRDEYPPFSMDPEPDYPASFEAVFDESRSRVSVFLRLLLVIPHVVVLALLSIIWMLVYFLAWLAILVTGSHPFYGFSVGFVRYSIRVEAYALLLTDEYPPFGFGE